MILYYFPITQNTVNKTVSEFFSEVDMLVNVCAHILLFFLDMLVYVCAHILLFFYLLV